MKFLYYFFFLFSFISFLSADVVKSDEKKMDLNLGSKVEKISEEKEADLKTDETKKDLEKEKSDEEEKEPKLSEEEIGYQGNWVKKREWLKESYKINDEIQSISSKIQKSKSEFITKYEKIDDELDKFYKQEGIEKGEVEKLFHDVNKHLEEKKKKLLEKIESGVTTDEEIKINLVQRELDENLVELRQLGLNVKSIEDLDKSISDRLKKLEEQIVLASEVSLESAKETEKLWDIIDDKKARAIYYDLKDNKLAKLKAIEKYIKGGFSSDFSRVISLIQEQMEMVSKGIDEQEKKGLIIKDRATRLEDLKIEGGSKKEQSSIKSQSSEKTEEKTWYQSAYDLVVNFFAKAISFFS